MLLALIEVRYLWWNCWWKMIDVKANKLPARLLELLPLENLIYPNQLLSIFATSFLLDMDYDLCAMRGLFRELLGPL